MQLFDTIELDDAANVRMTEDGYLVAYPKVARTGIQLYRGSELGDSSKDIVKVYRPESEVFAADSMHSFAYRPMTNDHPPVQVNAANWKDYAVGQAGGEVARDGEAIRVPMVLMDAGVINAFKAGKKELSVGYGCEIVWGAGTTPTGEAYDAMQKGIVANHIAVVKAGRAGKEFRIGDSSAEPKGTAKLDVVSYTCGVMSIKNGMVDKTAVLADGDAFLANDKKYPFSKAGTVYLDALRGIKIDAIAAGDHDVVVAVDTLLLQIKPETKVANDGAIKETIKMAQHVVDGITVEMSDTAIQVVQKHSKALSDSVTDLTTKLTAALADAAAQKTAADAATAKATTELATRDAQIVTLTKQVADAAITPAKLDQLVADRKVVADKARAVIGAALVVDGKSDDDIRAQVVNAKLGDAAKGWSADQVKVSFDTLTAGIDLTKLATNDAAAGGFAHQRATFSTPPANQIVDSEARYDARDKKLENAWKGEAGKA